MAFKAAGYRFDLKLEPSQYTTVPYPLEKESVSEVRTSRTPQEVFTPFNFPPLTEVAIRDLLLDWVRNKPLLSSTAARQMIITSTSYEIAYCYILETFTEQRSVCLRFEPHCKVTILPQPSTKPEEPSPWKVPVNPLKMFTNHVFNYRLVYTHQVTGCHHCQSQIWVSCKECCGSTRGCCPMCKGHRLDTKRPCGKCKGERLVPCSSCMALGRICCEMCVGKGQLCYFKELRVDYNSHVDYYMIGGPGGIPEERLTLATGEILHTSMGPTVQAITTFHIEEVNTASQRMVQASHSSWPHCKIVQQRHLLRAVPVTKVQYTWRETSGSVFIYGADQAIYWPDYPLWKTCFCCHWF